MNKQNLTKDGQLKIYQLPGIATFTFDSVLLARFTNIQKKTNRIVELCSGNGAISIMLTKKINAGQKVKITQIEIQEIVTKLAQKAIDDNNLKAIIEVICADVININAKIGYQQFDLVIVNPPYFPYHNPKNIRKAYEQQITRHEILINLEQIIIEANKLLTNGGYLTMIHRTERLPEIIILLEKHNLSLKRLQFVHPRKNERSNTVIIEARKGSGNGRIDIIPPLFVYQENSTHLTAEAEAVYF